MKEIIIMVHGDKRVTELSSLAKTLFPECNIKVVSASSEELAGTNPEKKIQNPELRIEEN